jgi:hypothetical protein
MVEGFLQIPQVVVRNMHILSLGYSRRLAAHARHLVCAVMVSKQSPLPALLQSCLCRTGMAGMLLSLCIV